MHWDAKIVRDDKVKIFGRSGNCIGELREKGIKESQWGIDIAGIRCKV